MIEFLQGKKTAIVTFLLALNTFIGAMGWVDPVVTENINWFLVALAGNTVHAAVMRTSKAA